MKIAVVDDIHRDRLCLTNYLESYFHNKNINFEILPYKNGEDFLMDFEAGKFQLVFLDIFMDGINGMDVARSIYQKDRDVSIIFQTNSEEYGAASYSVHALYYLVKPYTEENFRCAMELFDCRLPADEPVLSFSSDRLQMSLSYDHICYVDTSARKTVVHTETQTFCSSSTFQSLTEELQIDPRFLLCRRGVLVNMDKISRIDEESFLLCNGEQVPIQLRNKLKIKQTYLFYLMERMRTQP